MNPDALRASWAQAAAAGEQAAKHFYATLFLLAPDTRTLFPCSMTAQNDKLLAALGHIVSHVDDPTVLGSFAASLGADHRRFAVKAGHYGVVGQALLSTLEQLLGPAWTPQLHADWTTAYRTVAELMQAGADHADRVSPPWWDCQVLTVERRTAEILVFTVLPEFILDYQAGQSMPVLTPYAQGWRHLSPANAPREDGTIEFHLRAVGATSTSIVRRLQPGDHIRLGAPVGTALTEPANTSAPLLMVAGGTGVAPMRAVIEAMTRHRPRPATLVYGAATPVGLYDHRNLTLLAAKASWLTYLPTVELGRWPGHTGSAVDVALTTTDWRHAEVMICGSPRMVTATRHRLCARGVPPQRIHADEHTNHTYPPLATAAHAGDRR